MAASPARLMEVCNAHTIPGYRYWRPGDYLAKAVSVGKDYRAEQFAAAGPLSLAAG